MLMFLWVCLTWTSTSLNKHRYSVSNTFPHLLLPSLMLQTAEKLDWHLIKGLSLHLLIVVTYTSYTEICWLLPYTPCKKQQLTVESQLKVSSMFCLVNTAFMNQVNELNSDLFRQCKKNYLNTGWMHSLLVCLLILKLMVWGEKITISLSTKGIILLLSPSNAVLGFSHILWLNSVTLMLHLSSSSPQYWNDGNLSVDFTIFVYMEYLW